MDRLTREKHTDVYGQVTSDEKYEFDLAGNRTKKLVQDSSGNTLMTVNYSLSTGNRLGSWSVAETDLVGRIDVAGSSSKTIGTNNRFGYLWVSNFSAGATSPQGGMKPSVYGTNFWAYDFVVGLGSQTVVAAIRDNPGNMAYTTNFMLMSVVTNAAYQYDLAGCLTNRQDTGKDFSFNLGLIWNGQYQLTAVSTNGAVAEQFGYDGAGRRIFIVEGGVTNWMVYDGNQVVADLNSTGGMVRSYVWGPGIDNLISMTAYGTTTNTYYTLKDHLGSVLALTDSNGNIVESYRHDAWGRIRGIYNSTGAQIVASAVGNRYCWQGREYSWVSGLYYFRARWYDPVAGRWLSNDPIGISGGFNQYVFCGNNPVNFRDPSGKIWVQVAGTLLGAGANYVHNFSAYTHGKISGWQYVQSVLFGAGSGFVSTVIPGAGGVIIGSAFAGINDAYNQSLTTQRGIDLNQSGRAALIGLGSGVIGYVGQAAIGELGSSIIYDANGGIGEIAGTPPYNFGDIGGAIGLTGGTLLGDNAFPSIFSPKRSRKCP